MKSAYKRRKEDFKRRILQRIYTTKKDTFAREQYWLDMIKLEELRSRYYNLHSCGSKYWQQSKPGKKSGYIPLEKTKQLMREKAIKRFEDPIEREKRSQKEKQLQENPEYRKKVVEKFKNRKQSKETREKRSVIKKFNNDRIDNGTHHFLNFSYIKNTYWWTNGIINKRSKECPGESFILGQKKTRNII